MLAKSAEQLLRLDYLEYSTFVVEVDIGLSLSFLYDIIFSGLALLLRSRILFLIGDKSFTLIGDYSLSTSWLFFLINLW